VSKGWSEVFHFISIQNYTLHCHFSFNCGKIDHKHEWILESSSKCRLAEWQNIIVYCCVKWKKLRQFIKLISLKIHSKDKKNCKLATCILFALAFIRGDYSENSHSAITLNVIEHLSRTAFGKEKNVLTIAILHHEHTLAVE
jgi:hypothetical protein